MATLTDDNAVVGNSGKYIVLLIWGCYTRGQAALYDVFDVVSIIPQQGDKYNLLPLKFV